jgi:hypothetical protein
MDRPISGSEADRLSDVGAVREINARQVERTATEFGNGCAGSIKLIEYRR